MKMRSIIRSLRIRLKVALPSRKCLPRVCGRRDGCIVENIFADGDVAILEWRDPMGLRGVRDGKIALQRGYWDKLSFLRLHGLPSE
jgi:hypothetical protein